MDHSRGWGTASVSAAVCWPEAADVDPSDMDEAEDVRSAGSRGAFWAMGA